MKNLLFILLIFAFPTLNAQTIDERKTDIYFGNGVWNKQFSTDGCIDDDAADCSKEEFNKLIEEEIINGNPILQQKYGSVKLQYNWGQGSITDILETYYQLKEAEQVNGIEFFALMTLLFNGNPIPATISTVMYELRESTIALDEQANTLEMFNKYYDESLQYSHRVLLVSHSQGNMFANRIAKDFINPSPFGNYFANLQVASPASKIEAKKGDYVTAFVDPVINIIPGRMTHNANIPSPGHSFVDAYLSNIDPLDKIINKTKVLLNDLDASPSQWKLQNENTETTVCEERKAELVHFENAVSSIPVAYPFNEDGKVYQIPDTNGSASYVIGSADGTQIVDVQNGADSRCYELENTPDIISIENTCGDLNATSGVVTVDLIWTKKELDLDLTIEGPTEGEYLNKDKGCPREYFYIKDESGVEAGTYKIRVSVKGNVDESMVPESVSVLIKAKDKTEVLNIPVEDTSAFDMGYVAEIEVTEDKQTSTRISKITSFGTPIAWITSTNTTKNYIYEIIRLISQIYYGPVRDAHLEFYSISDYAKGLSPLFIGATSGGYDLHTAGLVFIPFSVVDQLSDNELYLLSAQGGEDIDADDDGKVDEMPTSNNGTLHGVLSGKMIKDGAYKVNILTELAYQVTKDMFDVNTSEVILERMDKVAQRLISIDVNGDKIINSNDLTKWLPTTDKENLIFDYNTTIEPIVQKLFNGEDIFMDAYKLLYYPVADAGENQTVGTTPPFILDGSKSYDINGNIVEYLWTEGDRVLCQSSEPVCEIDMLDIGTHNINLKVTDNDGEKRDDNTTIRVSLYAPVAKAGADQEIFENGTTFTLDGSNSYDSNGEITEYTWSLGETIYCQGTDPICVVENLSVADYSFTLKVTDDESNTATDTMNIIYPYKPVAVAGDDINTTYGTTVTLDGSNSYDSDGYIVEYKWSEGDVTYCSGDTPTCTINNLDAGNHVLKLQLTDDKGTVGVDSVNVKLKVEAKAVLLGSYDTNGYPSDVAISTDENLAYIADGLDGLKILNISNPAMPILIGSYSASNYIESVKLSPDGTIAYVTDGGAGLKIIDISNPSVPTLIKSYPSSDYSYMITLSSDGNTAYLADGEGGLKIIDVSNPAAPILIGRHPMPAWSYTFGVDISADENFAYTATGGEGVQIIDISNKSTPVLIESYDTTVYYWRVTLSEDRNIIYVTGGRTVKILDISNPSVITLLGSYYANGYSYDAEHSLDENIAYISAGSAGLSIIDTSNPETPLSIGSYDTSDTSWGLTLSVDGNTLYLLDRSNGLIILDVSSFSQ